MSNFGCDYSKAYFDHWEVLEIANNCAGPIGDPYLDHLHDTYNEGSPRDDRPQYYRFLYRLGRKYFQTRFCELGTHYGAATYHLLRGCVQGYRDFLGPSLVSSLEPRWGAVTIDVVDRIKPDIKRFFELNSCRFIMGSSIEEKNAENSGPFDVLLIDTDHAYDTTKEEFRIWEPKVKPGGLILFDDIDAVEYTDGCGKFFRELEGDKLSLPHLHPDSWGFGIYFKP